MKNMWIDVKLTYMGNDLSKTPEQIAHDFCYWMESLSETVGLFPTQFLSEDGYSMILKSDALVENDNWHYHIFSCCEQWDLKDVEISTVTNHNFDKSYRNCYRNGKSR